MLLAHGKVAYVVVFLPRSAGVRSVPCEGQREDQEEGNQGFEELQSQEKKEAGDREEVGSIQRTQAAPQQIWEGEVLHRTPLHQVWFETDERRMEEDDG